MEGQKPVSFASGFQLSMNFIPPALAPPISSGWQGAQGSTSHVRNNPSRISQRLEVGAEEAADDKQRGSI